VPWPFVVGLALAAAVVAGLARAGTLPPSAAPALVVAAGHAAMLGTALVGPAAGSDRRRARRTLGTATALITLAAVAATLDERGRFVNLATTAWLISLARGGRLAGLGVRRPRPLQALPLGAAIGGLLGGHLLLTAGRTLGYGLRRDGAVSYLAALAFDAGANVPATEAFFRGFLFDRLQRRRSLAAALAISSAGCLGRYLADPLLPRSPEVLAGAFFYVSLLSVAGGWLLWWSGSVLPGVAAAVLFFAAYRALGIA
jgi:hypothetical protein